MAIPGSGAYGFFNILKINSINAGGVGGFVFAIGLGEELVTALKLSLIHISEPTRPY